MRNRREPLCGKPRVFGSCRGRLCGGAALAEKPHDSSHAREPRAVESLRSHGDMVDKSYGGADKASASTGRTPQIR